LPSLNGGGTAAGVPPTQHRLYGRRFYRPKDPTNGIKELKEKATKENRKRKQQNRHIHTQ